MTEQKEPIRIELVTAPGCRHCATLEAMILRVLTDIDLEIEFETVDLTEQPEYAYCYRLFSAPAVIINGQREFQGRVSEKAFRRRLATIHHRS